jgi:transposase
MPNVTFDPPDLASFCRLDGLGLTVVGQRVESERAVLACRVTNPDDWCRGCGGPGVPRDTVVRRLAHAPFGWRPTVLEITVRRYRCADCSKVWRQDTTSAAEPRERLSRGGLRWALVGLVCQHLTVARVAECLGVSWGTANEAVLDEGRRLLIDDPGRFDHVAVIGVDEHCWRHTRKGDKYVTVIVDLTPVRDHRGPARLLDMVEGRSKKVFKAWLEARPPEWRQGVEVVAMDGFAGFKTAAKEALPQAVEVMDPFHVVRLASEALDDCRRRVQRATTGRRGRRGDPLYACRRTLHTGEGLLTGRQRHRLEDLFADRRHTPVAASWAVYQRIVAAYRDRDRAAGGASLQKVIDTLRENVPDGLAEVARLGGTLAKRSKDVLAYFDLPGTSNGPVEAINGRLEHLRGSALGFRSLTNYVARSLLEAGGFRPLLAANP